MTTSKSPNPKELERKKTAIVEAVKLACPEIMTRNTSVMIPKPFGGLINYRDDSIGIAEILRMLNKVHRDPADSIELCTNGMFCGTMYNWKEPVFWNLEKSFADQDAEVVEFLFGALNLKI